MALSVKKIQPMVYKAPQSKTFPETYVSIPQEKQDNSKKIIAGLAGLAVIGIASVAASKYIPIYNQKQIKKINETGLALADCAVKNKRNKKAVDLYNKHINHKKLEVLKYKLSHGMLSDKSEEAMEHIRNNLKKLEGKY
jgi:hypothetical protein